MRELLVVSYFYPPIGGAASQRAMRLTQHLCEHGIRPWVVSQAKSKLFPLRDESVLPALDRRVVRRPAAAPEFGAMRILPSRLLVLPDNYMAWYPFASARCLGLARRVKFEAVLTVSPPFTSAVVGLSVARRLGLPLVCDLSDPWTMNWSSSYPTPLHRAVDSRLEASVVRGAATVTVVSDQVRDDYRRKYAGAKTAFRTLPLGYDEDVFRGLRRHRPAAPPFRILYAGAFYGDRTPRNAIEALNRAVETSEFKPGDVEMLLLGEFGRLAERIRAWDRNGLVRLGGFVPYAEMVQQLFDADLLLLVLSPRERGHVVSTKVYEYLRSGTPILAEVPPGAAADLIRECRGGVVVAPGDVEALREAILDYHLRAMRDRPGGAARADVARFSTQRIAVKTVELLDSLSKKSAR